MDAIMGLLLWTTLGERALELNAVDEVVLVAVAMELCSGWADTGMCGMDLFLTIMHGDEFAWMGRC